MKKKMILAVLISMLVLPTFGINWRATEISPEVEMENLLYVNPQRINAAVNEMISIEVRIANAVNLYAYDFKFRYDNTILNCLDALIPPGHFLESPNIFNVKDGEIHQDEGFVWFAITILGDEQTKNGSGVLGIITFQVINEGWCALDLSDSTLISCSQDNSIQESERYFSNGYFATPDYSNFVLHDLAIIDVEISSKNVVAGDPVEIKVLTKNEGTETETFDIKVFYDDNLIGTQTVKDLPLGAKKTSTFNWETAGIALSNYTIRTEAGVVSGEIDIADNTYTGEMVRVYSLENSSVARINQLLIMTDLPQTEFERGTSLGLSVNYTWMASNKIQFCIDARAYDSQGKEISFSGIFVPCDTPGDTIWPHTSCSVVSIFVPEFAALGEAKIVVRILSDWLRLEPEEYARAQINFNIVG